MFRVYILVVFSLKFHLGYENGLKTGSFHHICGDQYLKKWENAACHVLPLKPISRMVLSLSCFCFKKLVWETVDDSRNWTRERPGCKKNVVWIMSVIVVKKGIFGKH